MIADEVLAEDMLDVLNVTPTIGISVLQLNKRRGDVGRTVHGVVNNNGLFAPGRHEDFHGIVVIAVGALKEGMLNALVCCVLSNPYGFRKFRVNIHPQSDRGNSNLKRT